MSYPHAHDKGPSQLSDMPGFGHYSLDEEIPVSHRFAHGFKEWRQVPAITQREFTMVDLMNELTDIPGWHVDIFSQDVVCLWRDNAFASRPLMSEKTWNWCVTELRDKAAHLEDKGYIRVLDTGSCVCKSDTLETELVASLQSALKPIIAQHDDPATHGIYTYVDPSRYPLILGKTRIVGQNQTFSRKGHSVGTPDYAAQKAPKQVDKRVHSVTVQRRMGGSDRGTSKPWTHIMEEEKYSNLGSYLWSYQYQWLPSEVVFTNAEGTDVRLVSYVNDLSPDHASVYNCLNNLISRSIEPWNGCLIRGQPGWDDNWVRLHPRGLAPPGFIRRQRGRVPCRIITYGLEWENEPPEWIPVFDTVRRARLRRYLSKVAAIDEIKKGKPPKDADRKTKIKYKLRLKEAQWRLSKEDNSMERLECLPEPTPEQWIMAKEYLETPEPGSSSPIVLPDGWEGNAYRLLREKIRHIHHFKHPEPGTAFTYDEWKSGTHGGKAVVNTVTTRPINPRSTPVRTPHDSYPVYLQDEFRSQGLQVITRIQGISLTPDEPEYLGGAWDLESQKNEHVVAVAIFAYDVQNVTTSHVSFRQETEVCPGAFQWGHGLYSTHEFSSSYEEPAHRRYKEGEVEAISEVFGFDPNQMCGDAHNFALPFQDIGKVSLPQGRLITFPNTMEHRREPFRLLDPTKGGHHRWITLMLVDPNYRICSTSNVPPQWN